jgi:DNA-binding SARP family transcriptional activator/tetratricopeptide (TPR) repeat protein
VLGPFRVDVDGAEVTISARKGRALLAELALRAGSGVPREEIVARLWPDSDDERGRDSFRHALWRLRAELGHAADAALITQGDDLRLAEAVVVDVREFEAAVRGDPPQLARAIDLYRGDLCKELEGDEAEAERTRLRGLLADAGRRLGEHQLAEGDPAAAVATARAVLRHDPYREDVCRVLLRAHAAAGDAAALAAEYRRLTSLLRIELGIDPSAETRALYARLVTAEPQDVARARVHRPRPDAPSTLFGRRNEHRRLVELLGEAIDRRGSALLILGEAGAGKTALLGEIARVAREHGLQVLAARAAGAEGQLAYQVWRDALRPHAAVAAALPVPWPNVLGALLPMAATAPDAGAVAPELERARLFEGVSRLVSSLAAKAPVAILIDDLHWVDADSLHLLAYIVRTLRGERVAVAAAARPAEADTSPAITRSRAELRAAGLLAEIELSSLDAAAVGALMRQSGVAATTAAWLAPRMATWTAGNPFFVLEATRALVEQGALRHGEAGLEWAAEAPSEGEPLAAQLPSGVRQTVIARVGVLPTETRQLLNVAAAAGATFAPEVVGAAAGRDEIAVVEALAPAIAARLLRDATLDGRPALAFAHDLVREATYQQMPSVMRSAIHRRVASALESRGAPSALLAYHFSAASEPERAATHWVAAAAQAERTFAHDEALRAYRFALSAMPANDRGRRMETLELAGDVHMRRGAAQDAIASYDEGMVACDPAEPESCVRLGVKIAIACGRHYGAHPHAREFAETGVAFFEARRPESAEMADALLALMGMQYRDADTAGVERTAARVRALCRRLDLPRQEASAVSIYAWSRYVTGDATYTPDRGDVERLVARLGDDDESAFLLLTLARPAHRRGEFAAALAFALAALRIAVRVGSLRAEEAATEVAEKALIRLGRWSDAIEMSDRRLVVLPRAGSQDVLDPLVTRAWAEALSGDMDAARVTARRLAEALGPAPTETPEHLGTGGEALSVYVLTGLTELLPKPLGAVPPRPRCRSCHHGWLSQAGPVLAVHGDPNEALRIAAELESLSSTSGFRAAAGYAPLLRGLALARQGRDREAAAARTEAERLFREIGDAVGLGLLKLLTPVSTTASMVAS